MVTCCLFHGLRCAERLVPPDLLARLLWLLVAMVALWKCLWRAGDPLQRTVAEVGGGSTGFVPTWRGFVGQTYARLATLWPDRFLAPAWRGRFTVTGLEAVRDAHAAGRPVVLAMIHTHHMVMLRLFLRVSRLPVAWLRDEPRAIPLRRLIDAAADRGSLLAGVPQEFSRAELRTAYAFLRSGNCLIVACDVETEDAVARPTDVGTMRVNVGPFRLASLAHATVIPAVTWQDRPWRFHLAFGAPMAPPAHASDLPAFAPLAEHCLATWRAVLQRHPEQVRRCRGVWGAPTYGGVSPPPQEGPVA